MSGGTYLQELSKNTEKRTKALKKRATNVEGVDGKMVDHNPTN